MKLSELLFLGALAVFAGVTLYGSLGMPFTSGVTFGPGFLPLIMSLAIIVIGGLIALRGMIWAKPYPDITTHGSVLPVFIAVALIVATLVAASFGSLLLPLGLCMVVTTGVLLKRSWGVAVVSTMVTLATIYGIFALWLHIPIT